MELAALKRNRWRGIVEPFLTYTSAKHLKSSLIQPSITRIGRMRLGSAGARRMTPSVSFDLHADVWNCGRSCCIAVVLSWAGLQSPPD